MPSNQIMQYHQEITKKSQIWKKS